jgi:hypothetical protein
MPMSYAVGGSLASATPHSPPSAWIHSEMLAESGPKVWFEDHTHSATGSWLMAWRSTGSTFVYTSLVSWGVECSSSLWVTAVDTPLWASKEANVFRRSWNLTLGNPAAFQTFFARRYGTTALA